MNKISDRFWALAALFITIGFVVRLVIVYNSPAMCALVVAEACPRPYWPLIDTIFLLAAFGLTLLAVILARERVKVPAVVASLTVLVGIGIFSLVAVY